MRGMAAPPRGPGPIPLDEDDFVSQYVDRWGKVAELGYDAMEYNLICVEGPPGAGKTGFKSVVVRRMIDQVCFVGGPHVFCTIAPMGALEVVLSFCSRFRPCLSRVVVY